MYVVVIYEILMKGAGAIYELLKWGSGVDDPEEVFACSI